MNKKDLGIIFGLFLAIALLIVFGKGFTSLRSIQSVDQATASASSKAVTSVKIGDFTVNAKIANKPDELRTGLSKTDSLAFDSGMLFVFDKDEKLTFWMKDMKFPIDIIWISKDRKIVKIDKNVPIEPDKKDNELTRYSSNALYVLEINAGVSDLKGIMIGNAVELTL